MIWMGGMIDMERKGYDSIGCYTCYVTFTLDVQVGVGLGLF